VGVTFAGGSLIGGHVAWRRVRAGRPAGRLALLMHIAGAGSSAGDVARPVTVSGQLRTSPAALPACRAVNWANTRARAGLGWA